MTNPNQPKPFQPGKVWAPYQTEHYLKRRDADSTWAIIDVLDRKRHLDVYFNGIFLAQKKYDSIGVIGVGRDTLYPMTCMEFREPIGETIEIGGQFFEVRKAEKDYPRSDLQVQLVPVQGRVGRLILPKSTIDLVLMDKKNFEETQIEESERKRAAQGVK